NTSQQRTTRAPALRACETVASVEPESITTTSSTRVPNNGTTDATTAYTVSASFSAGSTTDTVCSPLAVTSSSLDHRGSCHVQRANQDSDSAFTPVDRATRADHAPISPTWCGAATIGTHRTTRRHHVRTTTGHGSTPGRCAFIA